jgi:hypothetical protein
MLLQEFSERAAECLHLAEQAKSERDREFFIELGRAWCGVMEELGSETPARH